MAQNYANAIPTDERGNPMQGLPPPVLAQAATAILATVSSVITFNNNSTDIEVAAPNNAVAIKWIAVGNTNPSVFSSVGGANLDHVVPAGSYRKFVIPRETAGIAGPALANSIHGLYQRMAVVPVNGVISSILVTEY